MQAESGERRLERIEIRKVLETADQVVRAVEELCLILGVDRDPDLVVNFDGVDVAGVLESAEASVKRNVLGAVRVNYSGSRGLPRVSVRIVRSGSNGLGIGIYGHETVVFIGNVVRVRFSDDEVRREETHLPCVQTAVIAGNDLARRYGRFDAGGADGDGRQTA